MANLQNEYFKKAQQQREAIRRLLQSGTSVILEMPNHEVICPLNVEWLQNNGIEVEIAKDRDNRPVCLIDTSKVLDLARIPAEQKDRYINASLLEGNQRL